MCPCPCPSTSLSVCVRVLVRLCPCLSVSLFLSLSMSVSVLVPVRLCPCPFVSLSTCVPVPLCHCPYPFVSLLCPSPMDFFGTTLILLPEKVNGQLFKLLLLPTDNFQCLKPKDGQQRITFSAYFDPFNGPNQRKLLFESNLPSLPFEGWRHGNLRQSGQPLLRTLLRQRGGVQDEWPGLR